MGTEDTRRWLLHSAPMSDERFNQISSLILLHTPQGRSVFDFHGITNPSAELGISIDEVIEYLDALDGKRAPKEAAVDFSLLKRPVEIEVSSTVFCISCSANVVPIEVGNGARLCPTCHEPLSFGEFPT